MADGFETIGWILAVEDKATSVLAKMVKTMEKQTEDIAYSVGNVADKFWEWGEANGPIAKGAQLASGWLLRSFSDVFGTLRVEMNEVLVKGVERAGAALKEAFMTPIRLIGKLQATLTKEWTFGELLADTTKGVVALSSKFGKDFAFGLRSATTALTSFLQKAISIESIAKGFEVMGGIAGVLMGPLAPLMKLFSPLLDMIVRQITPAIETFSAIVESAFGPFSATLEVIARNLAMQIVPLITPLIDFMEIAAVQLGQIVGELLSGDGLEGVMASLMITFKQAVPVVSRIMNVLLDVGTEALGAIMDAMMELLPVLVPTFLKLLEAIVPLIPPLVKIGVQLLQSVYVPMLLKIAEWMEGSLIPFINEWMPAVVVLLGDVATRVADFFGNFGKHMNDVKILFIDPVTEMFTSLWNTLTGWATEGVAALSKFATFFKSNVIDPVLGLLQPVIDKISALAEGLKMLFGSDEPTGATSTGAALASRDDSELAKRAGLVGLSGKERDDKLNAYLQSRGIARRGLAEGGVVGGPMVPLIGEAGPELVLPLEATVVERVLAPLMPKMEFPALDRLVDIAKHIDTVLSGGTLRVAMEGGGNTATNDLEALNGSVGLAGGGAW